MGDSGNGLNGWVERIRGIGAGGQGLGAAPLSWLLRERIEWMGAENT